MRIEERLKFFKFLKLFSDRKRYRKNRFSVLVFRADLPAVRLTAQANGLRNLCITSPLAVYAGESGKDSERSSERRQGFSDVKSRPEYALRIDSIKQQILLLSKYRIYTKRAHAIACAPFRLKMGIIGWSGCCRRQRLQKYPRPARRSACCF